MSKIKKICFVASTGGHFEQIMMMKPIMDQYEAFIITEKTIYKNKETDIKTYYLDQVNRKEFFWIFKMIVNIVKSFVIFIKERPYITISTGALNTIPICILTKIFRRKLIFIESYAKITSPTKTGKFLYKFADRFYIQWKGMNKFYPKSIYKGSLY